MAYLNRTLKNSWFIYNWILWQNVCVNVYIRWDFYCRDEENQSTYLIFQSFQESFVILIEMSQNNRSKELKIESLWNTQVIYQSIRYEIVQEVILIVFIDGKNYAMTLFREVLCLIWWKFHRMAHIYTVFTLSVNLID